MVNVLVQFGEGLAQTQGGGPGLGVLEPAFLHDFGDGCENLDRKSEIHSLVFAAQLGDVHHMQKVK